MYLFHSNVSQLFSCFQALRSKFGDGAWERMTSQEKQKHLVEMKLAERKLRAEGRNEEANALFGDALHDEGRMTSHAFHHNSIGDDA